MTSNLLRVGLPFLVLLFTGCGDSDSASSGGAGASGATGGAGGAGAAGGNPAGGTGGGGAGTGGNASDAGARPPIGTVLPPYFGFGVSSFGAVLDWPGQVAASHGIDWNYLYWYQLMGGSQDFLEAKLQRANDLGAIPVITHYQLLDRGKDAGFSGDKEWDVVI